MDTVVINVHTTSSGKEIYFAHDVFIDLSKIYLRENTTQYTKFYLGKGKVDRTRKWLLPANSKLCICGIDGEGAEREEEFRRV